MSELNRCLCGGQAHANEIIGGWMVNCSSPQCGFEAVRDTREEAVSAWNTRPVEDALRARIAELEEALKPFAAEGMTFHPQWEDSDRVATSVYDNDIHDLLDKANFTVGDLRRAMRILGASSVYEKLETADV